MVANDVHSRTEMFASHSQYFDFWTSSINAYNADAGWPNLYTLLDLMKITNKFLKNEIKIFVMRRYVYNIPNWKAQALGMGEGGGGCLVPHFCTLQFLHYFNMIYIIKNLSKMQRFVNSIVFTCRAHSMAFRINISLKIDWSLSLKIFIKILKSLVKVSIE